MERDEVLLEIVVVLGGSRLLMEMLMLKSWLVVMLYRLLTFVAVLMDVMFVLLKLLL